MPDFMNFYQSIDVLIVHDIQEIATKGTLQTFFHIFNHLQQNRRQIIITCDRPPAQLEGMEERMLSRFKWGMVAAIEKPDTDLRLAILKAKIRRDGLKFFPKEVVAYIAQHVENSVRELGGLLNSLMMRAVCDNCDIDIELTKRVIASIVNIDEKKVSSDDIIQVVAQKFGVKPKEMTSKLRKQVVAQARQLAMYLIHKHTGTSYTQIGRLFGGRDHSTVLYSCDQVAQRITIDKEFHRMVDDLEMALKKLT
jgi:chromosomal replication initiator protein